MKDETRLWLEYADENLKSAQVLLGSQVRLDDLHYKNRTTSSYASLFFSGASLAR